MNMPSGKARPKKKSKKYHLDFSRTSLFFWSLGSLFLLAWIFVLGILVGRGLLPQGVNTLSKLRMPIVKFKEAVIDSKTSDLDNIKGLDKDPEFKFYDQLTTRKQELANKPTSGRKNSRQRKTQPGLPETNRRSVKKDEVSGEGGSYTVQVASLGSENKADKMMDRLKNRGYLAYVIKVNIKGKTYYRVRCGKFKDRKDANDYAMLLARQETIKGFVTKTEN